MYQYPELAQKIYRSIKRFDMRVCYVEKCDVMQEIAIAIIVNGQENVFGHAHRLVDNLLRDFGYSRKMGKDNFAQFYDQPEFTEEESELIEQIDQLYACHTAREVAQILDIEYTNKFQKIMCACFPKQMGLGGARKNAGNNKHLSFNN